MDQKLIIQMNIKDGDHEFTFLMPYGCPIGNAYNAGHQVLTNLAQMAKDAAEKAKAQENIEPELQ